MEIGHDRWQLSLKKTLFEGWQVTAAARLEPGLNRHGSHRKGGDHSSPEL